MTPRFCRRHVIAPGVALLIFSTVSGHAANAVPNAPTVAPAPMVDAPLAPAVGDIPGESPSPQHQWVPGHWRWSEGAYVWETGRWETPPAAGLKWQAPQWRREANGFVLVEGRWAEASPASVAPVASGVVSPTPAPQVVVAPQPARPVEVVVVEAPPRPRVEVVYARPSPRHVWVPGYWAWHGRRHVWIAGHYEIPPRGHRGWIEPRWERRGGSYIFIEGRWRL
ncbi:MAG: YXWGXW repeat-containing protein [Opitutaceae bacterium]|nr:YXWGXW repeat-containing protein [Opitutaceae bacterium]